MKIALITMDFPPSIGGVQIYLYEIARKLGKYHELTVATSVIAAPPTEEPFKRYPISSSRSLEFLAALRTLQPDRVIIGHAHPRLLLPAAVMAWRRYLTITHGNDFLAMQNHWHTPLSNWLLAASHPLITTSKFNAGRLRCLGFSAKEILPPGTDPGRFHPAIVPEAHPPALLTVSRLVPLKGIDQVIKILPALLKEFPDLVYVIVGEGPDRYRLEDLADEYQVSRSIRFLDQISYFDRKLPQIYRSADVFVMPCEEEGFGIVFLEASASGLPVVAGKSGGTADAVRDGETGFLIPPDDRQVLLNTLQRLLKEPDLRRKVGLAGRRFVEEQMNWDRAAEQMRKCIEEPGV
jgi:phosphatidylinositol alpha-1,6-mannosyltransferase